MYTTREQAIKRLLPIFKAMSEAERREKLDELVSAGRTREAQLTRDINNTIRTELRQKDQAIKTPPKQTSVQPTTRSTPRPAPAPVCWPSVPAWLPVTAGGALVMAYVVIPALASAGSAIMLALAAVGAAVGTFIGTYVWYLIPAGLLWAIASSALGKKKERDGQGPRTVVEQTQTQRTTIYH